MNDSLQKIIDDIKTQAECAFNYWFKDEASEWKSYAERLEALQKQPVAWMDKYGNTIKGTADSKYEYFTEPLIRAL